MPESKFNACAEEYRSFRPDYPEELYDFLERKFRLGQGANIVDLGAGTGKAAIVMAKRGWNVIGIELSKEMIEQGNQAAKDAGVKIDYRHGTAEDILAKSGSADLVTSAQAFHWFDAPKALNEIHRVLKPNGGLAIWWNARDKKKAPYLQAFQDLIHKYNPEYNSDMWGTGRSKKWEEIVNQAGIYTPVQKQVFYHEKYMTIEGFIGLANSFSYVGTVTSPDTREKFFSELRPFLEKEFPDDKCWIPYHTDLYSAIRK